MNRKMAPLLLCLVASLVTAPTIASDVKQDKTCISDLGGSIYKEPY